MVVGDVGGAVPRSLAGSSLLHGEHEIGHFPLHGQYALVALVDRVGQLLNLPLLLLYHHHHLATVIGCWTDVVPLLSSTQVWSITPSFTDWSEIIPRRVN